MFNGVKTPPKALPVCILMTGGYGCIGSWVARQVVEGGGEVWVFDLAEDARRLDLLLDDPADKARVHHVAGDVSDPGAVRAAVERVEATHLVHLAGLLGPACQADPIRGARVNVLGALAVFEAAAASAGRVERVVYASSAAVHGPASHDAGGLVGDEVRLAPRTHYGAFKVCNELNARAYWLDRGVHSIGLRPSIIYGVGRDGGVTCEPTRAILAAACRLPYRISHGGLVNLHYVGDVAATFLRALSAPFEGAEAFNLRGAVVSIASFVAVLNRIAPWSVGQITHGDRQLPIAPGLDNSRLLGWLDPPPPTPLDVEIAETFRRFESLHAGKTKRTGG